MNRRNFLEQALLLLAAAVLPALPETAPKLAISLDTTEAVGGLAFFEQQVSLLELIEGKSLKPAHMFDGIKMGLEVSIGELFEAQQSAIEAMIDQAHQGDPCIYCSVPHDEVGVGPCPGRVVRDAKQK